MSYLGKTITFATCGCTLQLGEEPIPEWTCAHGNFMRSAVGRIPMDIWCGNVNDPRRALIGLGDCDGART